MTTREGNEHRRRPGALAGLVFLAAFLGHQGATAAVRRSSWPRPTYYTVVARPGDTAASLSARYRVPVSVIAKLNSVTSTGRIAAGRVLAIPADTRRTREAVLSEALDPTTPNYAQPPSSPVSGVRTAYHRPAAPIMASAVRTPRPEKLVAHTNRETAPRFLWPIAGPVISAFGSGDHGTRNDGINIAAERGEPFRAAAEGTVSYVGALRGYGNLVLISHPHGYITAYAHAENIAVARGEQVGKGDVIGQAGNTGGVDRPQLHFEIRHGTRAIDPSLLLAASS